MLMTRRQLLCNVHQSVSRTDGAARWPLDEIGDGLRRLDCPDGAADVGLKTRSDVKVVRYADTVTRTH